MIRVSHRFSASARQYRQVPHDTTTHSATRSPGARPITFAPTAATVPAHSCPIGCPTRTSRVLRPLTIRTSVPQMAAACTRMSTSPSPASGRGTSRRLSRRGPSKTNARMSDPVARVMEAW